MTPEALTARLDALPPGGVEVLSRAHLDAIFSAERTLEAKKRAAVTLGERCGCDVIIVGTDNVFVGFTKNVARSPSPQPGSD